jgi:hypothetical protein
MFLDGEWTRIQGYAEYLDIGNDTSPKFTEREGEQ